MLIHIKILLIQIKSLNKKILEKMSFQSNQEMNACTSSASAGSSNSRVLRSKSCPKISKRKHDYRNKSQAWKYFELKNSRYFCLSDVCTNLYAELTATTHLIAHLKNNHEFDLIVGGEEAQSDESQDEQSTYVKETNKIKGAKFNETKQNQLNDLFVNLLYKIYKLLTLLIAHLF